MQQHSSRLLRQHALEQPHVLMGRQQPSCHTPKRGHRNQQVTAWPKFWQRHLVTTQPVCSPTF